MRGLQTILRATGSHRLSATGGNTAAVSVREVIWADFCSGGSLQPLCGEGIGGGRTMLEGGLGLIQS